MTHLHRVLTVVLGACLLSAGSAPAAQGEREAGWRSFDLDELLQQRAARGVVWLPFLDEPAMRAGIYHVPAGGDDRQSPHDDDEVYWVSSGAARMTIDDQEFEVAEGDVIYVGAGVTHRFHDVSSDLDLVVVFSRGSNAGSTAPRHRFTAVDQQASRDARTNTWNPFLRLPSMTAGLYMLPRSLDGDDTLVHPFDELNIVTSGRGLFTMGADTIPVGPGSIVYVERSVGHNFHGLTDDLDILIFWENPR